MPKRLRQPRPDGMRVFETRSHAWAEAGLADEIERREAKRAKWQLVVTLALIAVVMVVFSRRRELFPGYAVPVRFATAASLVVLGWVLARSLGRGVAPALFRRMDPGTAGTLGFLIRLFAIMLMVVVALRVAGLQASSLAVGGAVTAVVLGLAAQQTLGNLFAGIVILSSRSLRVGDRVRLVGGALAGRVEGVVSSLGLMHATILEGADRIMIPNNMLLNLAIVPVREPESVDFRARFSATMSPAELQHQLEETITVPTRHPPRISLEEFDRDDVILRITATPQRPADGAKLAEEVLTAARGAGLNGDAPEEAG